MTGRITKYEARAAARRDHILVLLAEQGGYGTHRELAAGLGLAKNQYVARLLDDLVNRGLIEATVCVLPNGHVGNLYELTGEGWQRLEALGWEAEKSWSAS
jgi:predicted ArsR family transcriptional regulator